MKAIPPAARFWKFVNKSGSIHPIHGVCWEWEGGLDWHGYGSFQLSSRKSVRSHRFSYSIHHNRELKPVQKVCHHCDNKKCVRPKHLFLSTQDGNMKDMVAKGRQNRPKGSRNGRAILTEGDVVTLRRIYKRRHPDFGSVPLAARYGVAQKTILKAIRGSSWSHVNKEPI